MSDWTQVDRVAAARQADAMVQGELVEVRVEAQLSSLPLVRTMANAVAMRADFDIDAVADLTLVADEVCTMLIARAAGGARLTGRFSLLPGSLSFGVAVVAADPAPLAPDPLGWRLLSVLVDSLTTEARVLGDQVELGVDVLITRRCGR